MQNERNSSIELLRIISMFFILCGHFVFNGIYCIGIDRAIPLSNLVAFKSMQTSAIIGANIFIIITGYFLPSYKITAKRFFTVAGEVLFYSYILLLIGYIFFKKNTLLYLDKLSLCRIIFPITTRSNWFSCTYLVACLFFPYIRLTIDYLKENKRIFKSFLVVCIICFSIIGTFSYSNNYVSDFIWFVLLLYVGIYIRLFGFFIEKSRVQIIILFIILIFMIMGSCVLEYLSISFDILDQVKNNLIYRYSFLSLFEAILCFVIFSKVKLNSKIINVLSKSTFAVYLIHEHILFSKILWRDLLHAQDLFYSPYMFIVMLIDCFIIFSGCICVDQFRILLMKLFSKTKLNSFYNGIIFKLDKLFIMEFKNE